MKKDQWNKQQQMRNMYNIANLWRWWWPHNIIKNWQNEPERHNVKTTLSDSCWIGAWSETVQQQYHKHHSGCRIVLYFYCRWATSDSFENCAYALANDLTRGRNNCSCTPRRPTARGGTRPIFFRSRVMALGTNAHLLAGVWSQQTHLPQHMQSRLNQCFIVPRGELSVFSTNICLKNHETK